MGFIEVHRVWRTASKPSILQTAPWRAAWAQLLDLVAHNFAGLKVVKPLDSLHLLCLLLKGCIWIPIDGHYLLLHRQGLPQTHLLWDLRQWP